METDTCGFGGALEILREGGKVARHGWNGYGMWVVLQRGYPEGIPVNQQTAEATGVPAGEVRRFQPYLMMHTMDGSFAPWVASQTDLLADDWAKVE